MMVLLFLFSGATCKFISQKITSLVSAFRVTLILVTVFSQINHVVMNNVYWHLFCVFFEVCFARAEKWKSKAPYQTHQLTFCLFLLFFGQNASVP